MKEFASYRHTVWDREAQRMLKGPPETVRIMVEAEGYAMVRFPGCMPFVVASKELTDRKRERKVRRG